MTPATWPRSSRWSVVLGSSQTVLMIETPRWRGGKQNQRGGSVALWGVRSAPADNDVRGSSATPEVKPLESRITPERDSSPAFLDSPNLQGRAPGSCRLRIVSYLSLYANSCVI